MNNPYPVIASVVEGHGEEKALLGLLHRLVPYLREGAYAHVPSPYRLPRDRKRLAGRGILAETEPGLFTLPRP